MMLTMKSAITGVDKSNLVATFKVLNFDAVVYKYLVSLLKNTHKYYLTRICVYLKIINHMFTFDA